MKCLLVLMAKFKGKSSLNGSIKSETCEEEIKNIYKRNREVGEKRN